jgi:hypothetical protein
VFFIVAAVAARVALALSDPLLNDADYILRDSGGDTRVLFGAFSEVILAVSVSGTAVRGRNLRSDQVFAPTAHSLDLR